MCDAAGNLHTHSIETVRPGAEPCSPAGVSVLGESLDNYYTSLMVYAIIVAACWLIFIVFWLINFTRTKRDAARSGSVMAAVAMRVVLVLAVVLLVRVPSLRHLLQTSRMWFSFSNQAVGILGSALCVLGVTIAVWARACLGTNWSPRPSVKIDHELVTSGPYHLIRHPIYSGMLLALFGTALDAGVMGLVIFFGATLVLLRRIAIEEGLMMQIFQDRYAVYRRHTKALLPFIV